MITPSCRLISITVPLRIFLLVAFVPFRLELNRQGVRPRLPRLALDATDRIEMGISAYDW